MKKIFKSNEMTLLIIVLAVWLIFGLINPDILSLANVYALIRASIIPSIFALACMLVIISGGIDMSFYAVGSFSSYFIVKFIVDHDMKDLSIWLVFGAAILVALILESINWIFIDRMDLPPFIVTLGTQGLFKGFLLAFVGTTFINRIPKEMSALGKASIASTVDSNGITYDLHLTVIIVVILVVLMHLLLEKTMFGRSIYAIGNDVAAAKRAGINVSKIRFGIYCLAGVLCAIGGVIHTCLGRMAVPMSADLVGQELLIIAAVMIGIGSGRKANGTAIGTILGVILLKLISNNLILLKVPSYWQNAVTGVVIIIGLISRLPGIKDKLTGKGEIK
jgi:simple sugar transport system permease protein